MQVLLQRVPEYWEILIEYATKTIVHFKTTLEPACSPDPEAERLPQAGRRPPTRTQEQRAHLRPGFQVQGIELERVLRNLHGAHDATHDVRQDWSSIRLIHRL